MEEKTIEETEQMLLKELNQNIKELIRLNKFNRKAFNSYEAADYLRVSYDTLLRLTRTGSIEYVANGTSYIYRRDDLDAWLFKNKRRKCL